jgi:hypothetical protein
MWSPSQPDAASDWWNFGASAAAAVASSGALLWSILIARQARRERLEEHRARTLADKRAHEQNIEAILAQAAAVQRTNELQEQFREERRLQERQIEAERRAARQALSIHISHECRPMGESMPTISGDLHGRIAAVIVNSSSAPITDVDAEFNRTADVAPEFAGEAPYPPVNRIGGVAVLEAGESADIERVIYVWGHVFRGPLSITVRFTDAHSDRWQLNPDRSLTLLSARHVDSADPAVRVDLET